MDTLDLAEYFEAVLQKVINTIGSYDEESGFTIVLENPVGEDAHYQDAPLFSGQMLATRTPGDDTKVLQTAALHNNTRPMKNTAADKTSQRKPPKAKKPIPEQIRRMQKLYQQGDGSFRQLLKNFYVQGKFMEDYEDNAPWTGQIHEYWPTYHNLSLAQLRGYFTWRTEIRKSNYQEHCTAFLLMYLSELINKIGTASAEESFRKMQEFEKNYVDAGLSIGYIRYNIRQWMFDFAVVNGLAPEKAYRYADRKIPEIDAGVEILRYPEKYSDQEVFESLCLFSGKNPDASIVIQKHKEEGIRLFAAIWRLASTQYRQEGKNLFTRCFGRKRAQYWRPLNNTLYYERRTRKTVKYQLNQCRHYSFKNNVWHVHSYHPWYDGHQNIAELLHEADRRLRLYLNTGRPLKERKEEAWVIPYIEAVIKADAQAKIEAARPKITIDFSGLDKIRQDALETQGCLLTEEEKQAVPKFSVKKGTIAKNADIPNAVASQAKTPKNTSTLECAANMEAADAVSKPVRKSAASPIPLDDMQIQLLRMLLRGESVQELIAAKHGMPNVIADTINETLFDRIGDTAVECDGKTLTLVEDYREDVINILGEHYF